MSTNREIAEQLVDKLRPRLVDLIAELLDEERGADDDGAARRLPGVSQEDYERCLRAAAGRSGKTKRKAG